VVLPAGGGDADVQRRAHAVCGRGGLRPGNRPAKAGAIPLLRRLLARLRAAFPRAILRIRLDGGFASPEVFAFLEAEGVEYVVAMASNVRLVKRSRRLLGRARMLSKASGQTEHLYGETRYAARKWTHKRRVIIKAEVVRHPGRDPKNNPRFVVTNLADAPEAVYAIYCGRGDMENRLKELHQGLALDRTSCHRFLALAPGLSAVAARVAATDARRLAVFEVVSCGFPDLEGESPEWSVAVGQGTIDLSPPLSNSEV